MASSIAVFGNDVYTAGILNATSTTNDYVGNVWKNGQLLYEENNSEFNSITVSSSGIYVVGNYYDEADNCYGRIWKDGEILYTTANDVTFVSAIESDGIIYIGGFEKVNLYNRARIWRYNSNGFSTLLSSTENDSYIYSITKNGNNLYAAGKTSLAVGLVSVPKIWMCDLSAESIVFKTSDIFSISSGSNVAEGRCIFVTDSDIYLAGHEYINGYSRAMLWKTSTSNNIEDVIFTSTNLSGNIGSGGASAVFVLNGDVYVGGEDCTIGDTSINGIIWKNNKTLYTYNSGAYKGNVIISLFVK